MNPTRTWLLAATFSRLGHGIALGLLLATLVPMAAVLGANPNPDPAVFQYEAALAKIQGERRDAENELAANYLKALRGLLGKAQSDGDLDRVKHIQAVIREFERDKRASTENLSYPESQRLAEAYAKRVRELAIQEAGDILRLSAQYDAALESRQKQLTKEGKFDQATVTQEERKTVAASELVASARKALAPAANSSTDTTALLFSPDFKWSDPENLGPGVNSASTEADLSISDDGLALVFLSYRSGKGDLFECRRASVNEPFGAAVALEPLNSPSFEGGPGLSGDGLTLLYHSDQGPGHQGGVDIYQSRRRSRNSPWERPTNLGTMVNSRGRDVTPELSQDGLTLLFASDRNGATRDYDLWFSRRRSIYSPWEAPAILGADDLAGSSRLLPKYCPDHREFLYSTFASSSPSSCYLATPGLAGKWSTQRLELPVKEGAQSALLWTDGRTVYFVSILPGGRGDWDIWKTMRVPVKK